MGAKKISEIVHEISKVSFNSLINAFSKASNADKACKKLKESKFGESQLPCFQSDWHFLIYRWTPADLDFLKNVFTEGNVTCLYNSFLHIFLKQLGFAEMFFSLQDMILVEIRPSTISFNSASWSHEVYTKSKSWIPWVSTVGIPIGFRPTVQERG